MIRRSIVAALLAVPTFTTANAQTTQFGLDTWGQIDRIPPFGGNNRFDWIRGIRPSTQPIVRNISNGAQVVNYNLDFDRLSIVAQSFEVADAPGYRLQANALMFDTFFVEGPNPGTARLELRFDTEGVNLGPTLDDPPEVAFGVSTLVDMSLTSSIDQATDYRAYPADDAPTNVFFEFTDDGVIACDVPVGGQVRLDIALISRISDFRPITGCCATGGTLLTGLRPAGIELTSVTVSGVPGATVTSASGALTGRCSPADLDHPRGVLDLADANAFVAGFTDAEAVADLAAPFGIVDLADLDAFVNAFLTGCP